LHLLIKFYNEIIIDRFRVKNKFNGVGRAFNIPPGTTVDEIVTHPTDFDFYLCSHEGPQVSIISIKISFKSTIFLILINLIFHSKGHKSSNTLCESMFE
jgi:hypothetical protein